MIKFHFNDTYLCCTTENQTENTRTQVNSYLKSVGFSWDKKDFCWKLFGLYIDANIIQGAKFLDDVEGSTRRLLQFKRELERRAWVVRFNNQLDEDCFKYPALNRGQKRAIANIISHEGFLLALKTGYGKSFIASTAFNHLQKLEQVDKLFIVSVNSMLWSWRSELMKFTNLKEHEIFVFDSKQNRDPWTDNTHKAIICSYDNMRVMISDIYKKNKTSEKARKLEKKYCYHKELGDWSSKFMMVVDESHFISSNKTKNYKFVKGISMVANNVVNLTATPFRKHWTEIYQQLSIIAPDLVGNYIDKAENYQKFLNCTAELVAEHSTNVKSVKEGMKKQLEPTYDRYIQYGNTVVEGIETYSNKVLVKLSDKHIEFYKKASQLILENAKVDGEGFSMQQFINNYIIFSQALADPSLVIEKYPEELGHIKWSLKDNEKFKTTVHLLNEHKGDKCILWVKNPALIDKLEIALEKYKPLCYHGKTKIPKGKTKNQYKSEIIEDFNTTDNHRLLITNEMSLGTGVTITGANVSITWVLPNNYVDFNQSQGRIRRFGQEKDVYYYMLTAEGTLDEVTFHNLEHRGYLNKVKTKYKYLRVDQIKSLLLGEVID